MDQSYEELSKQIRQLTAAMAELRQRVSALEQTAGRETTRAAELHADVAPRAPVAFGTNPAPLFGWAFLGLSGAYLLRALSESGAIPPGAGAVAGLLYAVWWLAFAARLAWQRPLDSTVHSVTAALIMGPLLWEATIRFGLFDPPLATAIVVSFTIFGIAVAWRHSVTAIAWVVTLAGLITLFAIFRATQDGPAWAAGVLAISAAVEFAACRDRWLGLRWAGALNANFTVVALTFIAGHRSAPQGALAHLSAPFVLGVQITFLAIYLASTADRTIVRKLAITPFETGQLAVALLIAAGGALHLIESANLSRAAVGLFCLLFSVVCYVISFVVLVHAGHRRKNFYTYSAFALASMLAALQLMLTPSAAAVAFAVCSAIAAWAARVTGRNTVRMQAAIFLVAAIWRSALIPVSASWLIQSFDLARTSPGFVYLVTMAAAWTYYAVLRPDHLFESVPSALLALWSTAGLAAVWISGLPADTALRTCLLAVFSVATAVAAVRWSRPELTWSAYALLLAAGLKLAIEDIRLGQSFAVFGSLLLFGGALIVVPRVLRGMGSGEEMPHTR